MSQKLQKTASKSEIPVQVFNPYAASKKYSYNYFAPSENVAHIVESHWSMHWDLTDEAPFKLELASSPFVAFTFTQFGNYVTGIHTGVYSYTVSGKGSLYGTLFKPTRFYELHGHSLSEITNKELPLTSIFTEFGDDFNAKLQAITKDTEVIDFIEQNIARIEAKNDGRSTDLTDKIIDFCADKPDVSIRDIASHFNMSERSIHQLFHDTVGVGIKWITVRNRLQKAMYIAAKSETKPNWTTVALELGYSDQSHFINDFKKTIGMSPSRYFALLASSK